MTSRQAANRNAMERAIDAGKRAIDEAYADLRADDGGDGRG